MQDFNTHNQKKDEQDEEELSKPIPFDDSDLQEHTAKPKPLHLGSKRPQPAPAKPSQEQKITSSDRITAVKTFYTKLHPGSIPFLDEQITDWLKNNPGITIKKTNVTTGDIHAKTTEPNLIIIVWY